MSDAFAGTNAPRPNIFRRSAFFWISVAFHALLILVAGYLVVQTITVKRKTSFEATKSGPQVSNRALEYKVTAPSSSASSPALAKRIAAQGASAIALPEMPAMPSVSGVTPMSMPGLSGDGLGFALGPGAGPGGGGGGNGGGGRISLFGTSKRNGGGVVGYLYDIKQTPEKTATGATVETYMEVVRNFAKSWDPAVMKGYYKARDPLYLEQIWVPVIPADEAPKAFGVEKEVLPSRWVIHYSGTIVSPESGTFRFLGFVDDVLVVALNKKLVLDGSKNPVIADRAAIEPWFKLKKGEPVPIDILLGEMPGGGFGGFLVIQNKKDEQKLPLIPQFSPAKMPEKKTLDGIEIHVADKPFVFK